MTGIAAVLDALTTLSEILLRLLAAAVIAGMTELRGSLPCTLVNKFAPMHHFQCPHSPGKQRCSTLSGFTLAATA